MSIGFCVDLSSIYVYWGALFMSKMTCKVRPIHPAKKMFQNLISSSEIRFMQMFKTFVQKTVIPFVTKPSHCLMHGASVEPLSDVVKPHVLYDRPLIPLPTWQYFLHSSNK